MNEAEAQLDRINRMAREMAAKAEQARILALFEAELEDGPRSFRPVVMELPEPPRSHRPSAELAARRAAGRRAYEAAFARRGMSAALVRSQIMNSSLPWLYGDGS